MIQRMRIGQKIRTYCKSSQEIKPRNSGRSLVKPDLISELGRLDHMEGRNL